MYQTHRFFKISLKATIPLVLLLVLYSLPASGKSKETTVDLLSPFVVKAEPRSVVAASVRATNNSQDRKSYEITADVPPDWQYFAIPDNLELDPCDSEIVFVSVNVPVGTTAGDYDISIIVKPVSESSEIRKDITVTVVGVAKLQVHSALLEQPDASSGEEVTQTFIVTNLGNAPDHILVEAYSSQGWELYISPEIEFDLEPYQEKMVDVMIKIPDEMIHRMVHRLTIVARSIKPGAEDVTAKAYLSTTVIPAQIAPESIYSTLDGDICILTSWQDDGNKVALFSLSDFETEFVDGKWVRLGPVNVLLGDEDDSYYTSREKFSAEYEDEKRGYVRGGDLAVDMESPLISRRMSGGGGDVVYKTENMDYRAFHVRTRRSIPERTNGMQMAYHFGDSGTIRFTGFDNTEITQPAGDLRDLESWTNYGLFAEFSPFDGADITGEIARSNVKGYDPDTAWRFNTRYRHDRFSANAEWLRANPGFRGGWQDTELKRVNVAWGPVQDLNIWMNYSKSENNLNRDPLRYIRENQSAAWGGAWNIENFGRLRVSHRTNRYQDLMNQAYDNLGGTTEYLFSRNWGDITTSVSWRDRTNKDRLTNETESTETLRLDTTARMSNNSSVTLGYSTERTRQNDGEPAYKNRNISLGTYVTITDDLDLVFSIQKYTSNFQDQRTNINGALRYEMVDGSRLNIRGRSYSGGDTEVALEFVHPVSIQLKMFPRKGSVSGRLFMSADPETGIPRAKISLGDKEVTTDDKGCFLFPAIAPGEYQLQVDITTMDVGLIPEIDLPVLCTVNTGMTTDIEIPVIESIVIAGKVILHVYGITGETEAEEPVEIPLILTGDELEKPRYRLADKFGRFIFADLRPGTYVLKICEGYLPKYHYVLEPSIIELVLGPGESERDLVFRIAPIEREIEINTEF